MRAVYDYVRTNVAWNGETGYLVPPRDHRAMAERRLEKRLLLDAFCGTGRAISEPRTLLFVAQPDDESIGAGSCWLLVEEPGRLTIALVQRGAWTAIRSRRVDERWRRVLPEILAREAAFLGLEAPCDRVIVCAQSAFDIEGYESFRLQALSYPELALA